MLGNECPPLASPNTPSIPLGAVTVETEGNQPLLGGAEADASLSSKDFGGVTLVKMETDQAFPTEQPHSPSDGLACKVRFWVGR
jgi:hypothetical protein